MNIINKGRCSRCIASKKEKVLIKEIPVDEELKRMRVLSLRIFADLLFCNKYKNYCKNVAGFICKEPPMGISAIDYENIIKGVEK